MQGQKFLLCIFMIGQGLLQDTLLSRGTCVSQCVPASHTLVPNLFKQFWECHVPHSLKTHLSQNVALLDRALLPEGISQTPADDTL